MSVAILAGGFAAFLACRIFVPILNEKQPRWYMAIGEWGLRRLKGPIILFTRMLERILSEEGQSE